MKTGIVVAPLCLSLPAFAGVTNVTHAGYFTTLTQAVATAVSGDCLLVSTGACFCRIDHATALLEAGGLC